MTINTFKISNIHFPLIRKIAYQTSVYKFVVKIKNNKFVVKKKKQDSLGTGSNMYKISMQHVQKKVL